MTIDRHRRTAARLSMLIALATLAVAACTGDGDDAAPPSTAPSSTESVPTTTEATTSTTEAPTTSTTTEQDVEAAVRAAHTRFMVDFFNRDELADGPEASLELAREVATGRALARIEDSVLMRIENGERLVSPGYESNIHAIEIAEDSAKVLDCSLDTGVGYSSDGTQLGEVDTQYFYRETWLVLENGQWLVEEFLVGGDIECEPDDIAA